jgi:hypothetical protein
MRNGGSPASERPPSVIFPERGGTRPMMLLSVVVLPAPFRPSRQTTSPSATSSERSYRMWLSP